MLAGRSPRRRPTRAAGPGVCPAMVDATPVDPLAVARCRTGFTQAGSLPARVQPVRQLTARRSGDRRFPRSAAVGRTRRGVPAARVRSPSPTSDQKLSAAIDPDGARSQDRRACPSAGNRAPSSVACACTCRRLVRDSVNTTHALTVSGCHPRSAAIALPSRTRRSIVPDEHLRVAQRGLELDDQQASRRCVPRQDVDDTALAVDREGDLGHRLPARAGPAGSVRRSPCIAAWPSLSSRSRSAPCQRSIRPDGRAEGRRHRPDRAPRQPAAVAHAPGR